MKSIKYSMSAIALGTLGLVALPMSPAEGQAAAKKVDGAQASAAARSPAEQQRQAAQQTGDNSIDKDAVAALAEAQKAVKAIADGKNDEAIAAIERATGKINVLTARKPAAALIPVKVEVSIIDLAPTDPTLVDGAASLAKSALSDGDYAKARYLLDQLASEIHIKTYNLPLATYPAAMQTAARLLDEKKAAEAKQELSAALSRLIIVDQALPLPLIEAQQAVKEAQQKRDQDKPAARKLLGDAKQDLDRAKRLGYAGKDPEYAALQRSISDLDKQLGGSENTTSAFASLREKMKGLFERSQNEQTPSASAATQAK